jgi:hypothetical protein
MTKVNRARDPSDTSILQMLLAAIALHGDHFS